MKTALILALASVCFIEALKDSRGNEYCSGPCEDNEGVYMCKGKRWTYLCSPNVPKGVTAEFGMTVFGQVCTTICTIGPDFGHGLCLVNETEGPFICTPQATNYGKDIEGNECLGPCEDNGGVYMCKGKGSWTKLCSPKVPANVTAEFGLSVFGQVCTTECTMGNYGGGICKVNETENPVPCSPQ